MYMYSSWKITCMIEKTERKQVEYLFGFEWIIPVLSKRRENSVNIIERL